MSFTAERLEVGDAIHLPAKAGRVLAALGLNAIRAAGFNDVKIISESSYPVELAASNPAAKDIMDSNDVSEKDFAGLVKSIVSIRVQGIKAKKFL